MKIVSALLSIGCFIPLVSGQGSLRASGRALQSLPELLAAPNSDAMPFDKKDLDHRKLAIRQQCVDDTLAFWNSVGYSKAYDAWKIDRRAATLECLDTVGGLECSVDSKKFGASSRSHGNLVRVCENASAHSYLYTYSASCGITLPDNTRGVVILKDIDTPECFAPSCTVDELDELATIIAANLADLNEQSLEASAQIASATCKESDPIGNPTATAATTEATKTEPTTTKAMTTKVTTAPTATCTTDDIGGNVPRQIYALTATQAQSSFGRVVSMSNDGRRLAVSSPFFDVDGGTDNGLVGVYERGCSSTDWTFLGGVPGLDTGDLLGHGLALSGDGSRMAIGVPNSDDAGTDSGTAVVFEYKETSKAWTIVGSPIDGIDVDEWLGGAISINEDGSRIAIGSPGSNNGAGHVSVYEYDESSSLKSWKKLGSDILGDSSASGLCGFAVSLSGSGSRVVIGCPDHTSDGKVNRGKTEIYEFSGGAWNLLTSVLGSWGGDQQGFAVSISSNGNRVATGAPGYDAIAPGVGYFEDAGVVGIIEEDGGKFSVVDELLGGNRGYKHGFSVELSADGNSLVVGAPQTGTSARKGGVKVYRRRASGIYEGKFRATTPPGISASVPFSEAGFDTAVSGDGKFIAFGSPGVHGSQDKGSIAVWAWVE